MENLSAKELRIGNLVYLVRGIREDAIEVQHYDIDHLVNNSKHNKYKPIPITEEWLTDLGFEKVGSFFEKDWLILHKNIKTGTVDFLLNEPTSGKYHATILKYVHQLQNLYFSLTGEEL